MKKQMKWLLPLLLVGGVAQAAEQPANPEPTAEELCQLPLAESAEERAVQQVIRSMGENLAESLPGQMDSLILEPAEEIREAILESLRSTPEADRTQEINDLIADIEQSEVQAGGS